MYLIYEVSKFLLISTYIYYFSSFYNKANKTLKTYNEEWIKGLNNEMTWLMRHIKSIKF